VEALREEKQDSEQPGKDGESPHQAENASKLSFGSQQYLRIYCLLCALSYPTWSVALKFSANEDFALIMGRIVVGLFWLVLYMVSVISERAQKYFGILAYFLSALMLAHFGYTMTRSGQHDIHAIVLVVLATISTSLCFRVWQSAFLFFESIVIVFVFVWVAGPSMELVTILLVAITVLSVFSMVMLQARMTSFALAAQSMYRVSLLEHRLVMQEMETAKCVQESLFVELSDIPGVTAHSFHRCASKVGGDWRGAYYDAQSRTLFFWIGDVTGHGIGAALMTAVAYGALVGGEVRMQDMASRLSLEERLLATNKALNTLFFELSRKSQKVMTLFSGALNVETGELKFLNSGHNFPWLVVDGEVKALVTKGNPVGFRHNIESEVGSMILPVGAKLFCYTDGLFENQGGPRSVLLPKRVLRNALKSSTSQMGVLLKHIENFFSTTDIEDDVTVFLFEWNGNPAVEEKNAVES
jgi:serine phosphatase RsbU (regulator of sigma subunit)